jgi:hypothetical protein
LESSLATISVADVSRKKMRRQKGKEESKKEGGKEGKIEDGRKEEKLIFRAK